MALINGFTIFGFIFLVISLIASKYTKKEKDIENPNCKEEVNDVKTNVVLSKVLPLVSLGIILVGVICWLVTGGPIVD